MKTNNCQFLLGHPQVLPWIVFSYFSFTVSIFHIDLSITFPLLGKLDVRGPPCGGSSCGQGRHGLPFKNENSFLQR